MGLKKGMINNPKGRPKGSVNKVTADLRNRISDFLDENWEQLQNDFDNLDPKDRLLFYERLLQYGLPKLQSTELISTIDQLSDQQLDYIINELKNTIK